MTTKVSNLLENPQLALRLITDEHGLDRAIVTPELNRPSLELTGYFSAFSPERIQVIGKGEASYTEAHETEPELRENIARIMDERVPCVIITNNRKPHPLVVHHARAQGIPLLAYPHRTTKLYMRLWRHLDEELAPETTMHGVLMDIHDIGVLLLGHSAVGKSECALELILRGFHLVADDMVAIKCLGDSELLGLASNILPYHMEARGIGIIDIRRLFGVASIRPNKHITLAITLEDWDDKAVYERTGLVETRLSILDVDIPHVTIPVRPGRKVSTLVEVAALNYKLKSLGINTALLAEETLLRHMEEERAKGRQG